MVNLATYVGSSQAEYIGLSAGNPSSCFAIFYSDSRRYDCSATRHQNQYVQAVLRG